MFTKVLVPLDGSPLAEQAISPASRIARTCGASLELVLVHVTEPYAISGDHPAWLAAQLGYDDSYVARTVRAIVHDFAVEVTGSAANGLVVDAIATRAQEVGADLIVMTSHGRTGMSRAWFGSVADGVIRRLEIPVLLLRPSIAPPVLAVESPLFRRIVIPLDGSPESHRVLEVALVFARGMDAEIALVRVITPVPLITPDLTVPVFYSTIVIDDAATKRLVADAAQQLGATAQMLRDQGIQCVNHQVVVAEGVARAVVDFASACDADLIAMSSHGRGVSRLLIGSVADKILRSTSLPVLLKGASHAPSVTAPADFTPSSMSIPAAAT